MNRNKMIGGFALMVLGVLFLAWPEGLEAQCAMCKATAEQSDQRGLNMGILYLFATPYLIVGTIGYFWWRNRRKQSQETTGENAKWN